MLLFKDGFSDKVVEKIVSELNRNYSENNTDGLRYLLNTLSILGLMDDKRAITIGDKLKDTYLNISGKTMKELTKDASNLSGNWFFDEVREIGKKIGKEEGKRESIILQFINKEN